MSGGLTIWSGRATPLVLDAVEEAFRRAGDPKERDVLDWQYLGHRGGAYVAIAHDDRGPVEGVAATYASLPTLGFDGERRVELIQSIDTLTLPEYRGRGLVGTLGSAVYELARRDGVRMVYGFPNDAVLSTRVKHLGWTIMDPLPMLVRPIGWRYARVRARLRTPTVATSTDTVSIPEELDEMSATDSRVGIRRTVDYLRWRLARPGASYRTFETRDRSGRLAAWGASELSLKHGCGLGYVMELVVREGANHDGVNVLRRIVADLRHRGADLVLAWALPGSERSILLRRGFLPLPERLRPVSLHFGARPLPESTSSILDRSRWRLSYLDSDTV